MTDQEIQTLAHECGVLAVPGALLPRAIEHNARLIAFARRVLDSQPAPEPLSEAQRETIFKSVAGLND